MGIIKTKWRLFDVKRGKNIAYCESNTLLQAQDIFSDEMQFDVTSDKNYEILPVEF
jgi:hypothetical protein